MTACCALLTPTVGLAPVAALAASDDSHGGPSAGAIASSKQAVAARERQVAAAATSLVAAKAAVARLTTAAEVAVEAYDGAVVALAGARRDVRTARLVLGVANRQVASGQAAVSRFATAAYESGGTQRLDLLLSPGGPGQVMSGDGALNAISTSQRDVLQQLAAARVYQAVVSRQTESVAARAAAAAATAASAKRSAQTAVARQAAMVKHISARERVLRGLLGQARDHASQLERARLAAIARARAAAARAAAAAAARQAAAVTAATAPNAPSPYSGSSGSTAGTISAAIGAAAVSAAESQLGKPYQWAAVGPDTYDCSGLVMWAYDQVGVSLEHYTGDQWNEGAHVSRSQLRPGDLVFFATDTSDPATIHHVGMYIGNAEMVEAPFTGANVRISGAFRPDYIGAVRPYQQ